MLLKRGSSGPDVSRLAEQLVRLGYHPGPASASFDDALARAVKAFQMQNADSVGRPLVVDGIVGPVTAAAIARRLGDAPPAPPTPLPGLAMPATGATWRKAAAANRRSRVSPRWTRC